ncbi:MAG: hypothetical protein Q9216_001082 [Gyalolechia sp. 2 TL-2023]
MDHHEHSRTTTSLARYAGEDTRLTRSFIPITLEQLARERGVLLDDRSKSCLSNLDQPILNAANSASVSRQYLRGSSSHANAGPCIIQLWGININTASFAMYTFSISVFIQSLVIISMSGAADHGIHRKRLLLLFAFIGAAATTLFIAVIPAIYLLGGLLAIIANVCFGASFVLLNSFLPLLVRHHPTVQAVTSDTPCEMDFDTNSSSENGDHNVDDSTDALLGQSQNSRPQPRSETVASSELMLSTRISSNGIGIGYIAAIIVQLVAVAIILLTKSVSDSTTVALRVVLCFIGLWWSAFTVPAALWLRPRPGPPIPFSIQGKQRRDWARYISYAWGSLWKTVRRARHLKDIVLFLAAWFLLSDGIATVSGTAVLFGKTELGMTPAQLAMINVVVTLFGIAGAFLWRKVSRLFGLPPARTIVACICIFELIPVYALIGYIPAVKNLGVFGLQQPWEMYILGAVYGVVLGGLSSYCRSLYGELIPPGSEAAFYALYAITDKGSSIFGPAIVGVVRQISKHNPKSFIVPKYGTGRNLITDRYVDVDRGKEEGAHMAKELGGSKDIAVDPAGGIVLIDEETAGQEPRLSRAMSRAGKLAPEVNRALFVKNLSYNVTAEELFDLFGKFGPVRQIRQGIASNTKGTAFVVYEDVMDAKQACDKLNGFNFQNRYLVVLYHQPEKMAKSKEDLAERQENLEKLKRQHGIE